MPAALTLVRKVAECLQGGPAPAASLALPSLASPASDAPTVSISRSWKQTAKPRYSGIVGGPKTNESLEMRTLAGGDRGSMVDGANSSSGFGRQCNDGRKPQGEPLERAAEPTVKTALLPLPPGAVEPSGWLRDWAQAAREGITGHLYEWHPVYRDGWKGSRVNAPNANPDGTGWPLEQCAYWLDGALRLGFVLHDEALIRKIRARLDPIVDGVNKAPLGTSFIYWKPDYKPVGFDSWAHSHMGRALVALYDATREQRVLDALVKVYADYPAKMGTLELGGGVSGLCNLDPMLETYAFSGDRRILERALQAIAQPEVTQSIQAWQEEPAETGSHGDSLREHPPACGRVSLVGRSTSFAGHPRRIPVAGQIPHAPLWRGLGRGIRFRGGCVPQNRDLRCPSDAAFGLLDVSYPRHWRMG